MSVKTLDELMIEFGADKATKHPTTAHSYAPIYDRHFERFRDNDNLKVLEIGVGSGPSIQAWLEYFPQGQIYGVDIVHDTNPWNTPKANTHFRYTFVTGDQSCPTFWACFIADYGSDWDIIIDDGGHYDKQIVNTFNCLWPHVKPDGLYCIEDLACAFSSIFLTPGVLNPSDMIQGLGNQCLQGRTVGQLHLSKELAIIRKG